MGLKQVAIILTVLMALGISGCKPKAYSNSGLELNKYPNVLLPAPDRVILNRDNSGSEQEAEIVLTKADITTLLRVLRSAVDVSLNPENLSQDAWSTQKRFSLQFEYKSEAAMELIVNNKPLNLKINKALFNLEGNVLLVQVENEVKSFSGLLLSDEFRKFMREYRADSGFPLPPAKKDGVKVEQLPLARPGGSKIDFLPPAQPRRAAKNPH